MKRNRLTRYDFILNFVSCTAVNKATGDTSATMAEWLRRWTRNPMGYSRTGSNPVRSVIHFTCSSCVIMTFTC